MLKSGGINIEFDDIDKLMAQRQQEVKKEKSQIGYALSLIVVAIIICLLLRKNYYIYAISLGGGIVLGIILRFSRFCFTAAFRDIFIIGNTKVMRAVILGLIVSTIGFGVIQSRCTQGLIGDYRTIPGTINPVGIHVMLGAFIFGIGMVLAGGCGSGLLMRIGEGHTISLIVLVGFIIGSVLGAKDYGFWHRVLMGHSRTIYFPDYLNLKAIIVIQVTILIILYKLALWYEKSRLRQ